MANENIDLAFGGIQDITQVEDSIARPKTVSGGDALNQMMHLYTTGQALLAKTFLAPADAKDKGDSLGSQLREAAKEPAKQRAAQAIEAGLKQIFDQSRANLGAVQTEFNETYKGLTQQVEAATPQPDFKYHKIPKYIQTIQASALEQIEQVHQNEMQTLKAWLGTNQAALAAVYPDIPFPTLEKQLITQLEDIQKSQVKQVKDTLEKAHEEQYCHIKQERERINLLKFAADHDEEIKGQVRDLNAPHVNPNTTLGATPTSEYKGVELEKIKKLVTATGNAGEKDYITIPGSTSKRILTYKLPFLESFFGNFKKETFQDLLWLAKKMKAKGTKPITMTITTENPGTSPQEIRELAQECFRACAAAGYNLDDIIIKGPDEKGAQKVFCGVDENDKDKKRYKPSELITDPEKLKTIEKLNKRVIEAEKNALDPRMTTDQYKQEVAALRNLGAQVAQQPQATQSVTITPQP